MLINCILFFARISLIFVYLVVYHEFEDPRPVGPCSPHLLAPPLAITRKSNQIILHCFGEVVGFEYFLVQNPQHNLLQINIRKVSANIP